MVESGIIDVVKISKKTSWFELSDLLHQRSARLEDVIRMFAFRPIPDFGKRDRSGRDGVDNTDSSSAGPNTHMLRARKFALDIFFYRRIRNVHSRIFQGRADSIMNALTSFDMALAENNVDGSGTVWPASICCVRGYRALEASVLQRMGWQKLFTH